MSIKRWLQSSSFVMIALFAMLSVFIVPASADAKTERLHFLVPGGAGGGWDGTARGTGEALTKSGLVESITYENMSGGGGGKAIGYLIENAKSNQETLMVNSTPIIIRSLVGRFPYNFRDLTLVSGIIGDYQAIITSSKSPYQSFSDLLVAYKKDPDSITIGGGSVPGSMDHLFAAMAMESGGIDPTAFKYIPFDAGGKLSAAVLSEEVSAGATGFSEAIALARSGDVRILAVSSEERVPAFADAPTFIEQGYQTTFINWRGFFGPPNISKERSKSYQDIFAKMYDTPEWEVVRERNGWVNMYYPGEKFTAFLTKQEKEIKDLMIKMGFLKQ